MGTPACAILNFDILFPNTGNDVVEKIFIFLDTVQNFLQNFHSRQFLFLAQDFWYQLRAHFPHRKILCNNGVYGSDWKASLLTDKGDG